MGIVTAASILAGESLLALAMRRRVRKGELLVVSAGDKVLKLAREGGLFVWPGQTAQSLSLAPVRVALHGAVLHCAGGQVVVRGEAELAIDATSMATLARAAGQFLGRSQDELMTAALRIIERQLATYCSARDLTELHGNPGQLAEKTRDQIAAEMREAGLKLLALTVDGIEPASGELEISVDSDSAGLATVVTTNNSQLLKQLGGNRAFDRLRLAHLVANSGPEAFELIRRYRPVAALVDAEQPGLDAFELCRAAKAIPGCRTRIALLVSRTIDRELLRRVDSSGCDDLLCLPLDGAELHEHLASLVGAPYRRSKRTQVALPARLLVEGVARDATLADVSDEGARIEVAQALAESARVELAASRAGAEVAIPATVVWCRAEEGTVSAGVRFDPCAGREIRTLRSMCCWSIEETDGGVLARIHGEIGDESSLERLSALLHDAADVDIDLSEVSGVTSTGSARWRALVDALAGRTLRFHGCTASFLSEVAAGRAALGDGKIDSLALSYRCAVCDTEETRLLQLAALTRQDGKVAAPTFSCPICSNELVAGETAGDVLARLPA